MGRRYSPEGGRSGRSYDRTKGDYKSKLEERVAKRLEEDLGFVSYEPDSFEFVQPAIRRRYTPDFKLRNKVYIEAKGRLTNDDRKKLLWFKEQHPEVTIYLLFGAANNYLYRGSSTTYAQWAEKNGFEWADFNKHGIPKWWIKSEK